VAKRTSTKAAVDEAKKNQLLHDSEALHRRVLSEDRKRNVRVLADDNARNARAVVEGRPDKHHDKVLHEDRRRHSVER